MRRMLLDKSPADPCTILCIGAHCDDVEIGCGGTLLKLQQQYQHLSIRWVVFSGGRERERECRASADQFLARTQCKEVEVLSFRDGFMPFDGAAVKGQFERIKGECDPDVVLTHYRQDRHQDHRLLSDLTWNTFRDHLILEYEIPKYDGDFGQPNVFVGLEMAVCAQKIASLMDCYPSQRQKRWFSEDTFRSMLHLRGMECGAENGLAEAFYGRKLLL